MDDIYIETWAGMVMVWEHLVFRTIPKSRVRPIERRAATRMGDDGKVEVTFTLDETWYGGLRKIPQKIFEGKDYYHDGTV